MNPAKKGWLKEYIIYRALHPIDLVTSTIADSDRLLYKLVQPTGLIYGHPIHPPAIRHPKHQRWNSLGKMKIVLLENFLHSAKLKQDTPCISTTDWSNFFWETSQAIGDFYETLDPTTKKKSFFHFGKSRAKGLSFAEQLLHNKLFLKSSWDHFWPSLFQNSLLFLDCYYFGEWRARKFHNMKWHKDSMKLLVLKIIASASHANQIIERHEKNLFFTFLSSSKFTKRQTLIAKEAFRDGITLDQIDLRQADTWILKKYVLELTILMIWSDHIVGSSERVFLNELASRLGFEEIEVDISILAIESFVIENWKEVYFLQSKHSFQVITETVSKRITKILMSNEKQLYHDIQENTSLWSLLEKLGNESISPAEKETTENLLIDIIKALPDFATVMLPRSFLRLPLLLRLIPARILPKNFLA